MTTKKVKLDRTDMRILAALQENGRITNVELAKKVGLSAPPCLRRVQALEKAGFVRGYHAELAADMLGYGVTIFTEVNLKSHHDTDLDAFGKQVAGWPMVRECYLSTGDADALMRVVAESWETYQKFLTTQVMASPHVSLTRSTLVIKTVKTVAGIPVGETMGKGK